MSVCVCVYLYFVYNEHARHNLDSHKEHPPVHGARAHVQFDKNAYFAVKRTQAKPFFILRGVLGLRKL